MLFSSAPVRAEVQTTVVLTAPAETPGASGAFSVSQASGPAASASGTALDTYAGVRRFTLGSGSTGRYSVVASGTERYGVLFDTFQLFQNFLTANQFTIVSSGSSCPSAGTYTWIKVRFRTSDATRSPMSATDANERIGGVAAYDSAATYDFAGASYFNLSGPTLTTAAYNIDRLSSGCASGSFLTAGVGNSTWDPYGTVMFGSENFAFLSEAGSPIALVGAPQVTLNSGSFSALDGYVFTGLMTIFQTRTTQTRKNVYLVPDSAGTTFTIREATSLTDPFTYAGLGTLTCTSLNSPTDGFCSGTLTISGEGGSGKAVCQLSTPGSRTMLACAAQRPSDNTQFVSFITATSPTAVAAATPDTIAAAVTPNPGVPPDITVTVSNLTGRKIASMGQPSNSGDRPQAPFTYKDGNYPGTGGTCGTDLAAYTTCTVALTYNPTALGGNLQTFRQEYDNGGGTVQATGNVRGVTGLSSIAITPSTASYTTGGTQQFTATATYSDSSTQDVTSLVAWSSNNISAATISQTGLASFIATGTAEVTATAGGVTSNAVSFSVTPGPSTVDTSSSQYATAENPTRRVFYDSVNDRHWAFYLNGTDIEYSYSADDGGTWTSGGTISTNTYRFDVAFKVIGGTAYVFVVNQDSSSDILLRRGTCGASLIAFDSAITYLDGTTTSPFLTPAVGISASDYVWVAAFRSYVGERAQPYRAFVVRSTNVGSGTLSAIGTVTGIGQHLVNYKGLVLTPRTGSDMYLIVNEGPAARVFEYTSSAWKEAYSPTTSTAGKYSKWVQTPAGTIGIYSVAVVSATEIYVAGNVTDIGGNALADGIAKWNGTSWEALGSGVGSLSYGNVVTVVGDNVYFGGAFTNMGGNTNADNIARWDKTQSQWYALGVGIGNSEVNALYHDGTNLFVGGGFTGGGGNTNCARICRWNGSAWASLSTGVNGAVNDLASDGTNLYVGGGFTNAGGNASADRIALWNGSAWSALGSGAPNGAVAALYHDGTNLYMGGSFTNGGGVGACDYICRWNGSAWSAMSTGLQSTVMAIGSVGSNVYAVGNSWGTFNYVARFNGTSWSDVGTGGWKGLNDNTNDLKISGSNVYVAGNFSRAGDDFNIYGIARLDDTAQTWHPVGSRADLTAPGVTVHATSTGRVYMSGPFANVGGNTNNTNIVEWTPFGWTSVSTGINDLVRGLASNGSNLYIAGDFKNLGGNAVIDNVARWDGSSFHAVGVTTVGNPGEATWGLGGAHFTGSNLYVWGNFTDFGGNSDADSLARWDGAAWSGLSVSGTPSISSVSGTDSALYVGGTFSDLGGNASADGIAKWNGSSWEGLGTGVAIGGVSVVLVDGSNVYAGGTFTDMGGVSGATNIARWDGASWNAMGSFATNNVVYTIAKNPVTGGIYIGGDFTDAGGNSSADNLAVWNGSTWEADGPGFPDLVVSMAIDASGRIFVTGDFGSYSDGSPAGYFAYKENVAALAASNSAAEVSATTDASGNLLLASINSSGYVAFDTFNTSTGWANSVALNATTSANPCISTDNSSGDRYGFWRETNTIKYKRYTSSAWGSAVTSTSSGTNTHLGCDPLYTSAGKTMLLWTHDAGGGSYDVKALAQPP